jgi:outer membrane protein
MGAPPFDRSMTARLLLLAALAPWALVRAQAGIDDCRVPSEECAAVGKWNVSVGLGAGVRTNPLVNGEDIPLVVVPHVSYYGKRFFLDDLDVGFTLVDNDSNTLSLIASPGYDRVYFYRTDPQNFFITGFSPTGATEVTTNPTLASQYSPGTVKTVPRPARRFTYLAGPEWTFKYDGVSGQLDLLHEITDQDNGDEIRAGIGIPLWKRKGALIASFGVTWKSAGIVNYYYGEPGVYGGASALDPYVKLAYTLPLSSRWRFNALVEYERLGNAIANSPIVAEHTVATMFVGTIYTF